jgi:hypothetical protein
VPRGHKKHWRRYAQRQPLSWEQLSGREGVRARLEQEAPEIVRALDLFAKRVTPMGNLKFVGWSPFCHWLETYYRQTEREHWQWPTTLHKPDGRTIRQHIFQHLQ